MKGFTTGIKFLSFLLELDRKAVKISAIFSGTRTWGSKSIFVLFSTKRRETQFSSEIAFCFLKMESNKHQNLFGWAQIALVFARGGEKVTAEKQIGFGGKSMQKPGAADVFFWKQSWLGQFMPRVYKAAILPKRRRPKQIDLYWRAYLSFAVLCVSRNGMLSRVPAT